jgi:hypothetical protein
MKFLTINFAIFFLLSGCSHFDLERTPANTAVITETDVTKVFEFEKSNIITKDNNAQKLLKQITDKRLFAGTYSTSNEIMIEFVEDGTLPKNIAYYPQLRVENNKYIISLLHSKDAPYDLGATSELQQFIYKLKDQKYFISHFAPFEMYFNAQGKDATALYNFAKIREVNTGLMEPLDLTQATVITKELETRNNEWAQEKMAYAAFEKSALKIQRQKDEARRAVIESLDTAVDEEQFKNLVAKNDRKGVASLLKKYLPWEQIPPFEKQYWENYLSIMVNPLPHEQRILVYRGVSDDVVQLASEDGVKLSKEEALKEGKVFFMSTMLTKNQGTWNRRLRSLTAMYEKFIATDDNRSSEYAKSARIVTMFTKHSREPQGSPFLSLTPKFSVAQMFGGKRMSAYTLDPRLISFNFTSRFKNEVEFLLPLIVFPDEVTGFYDQSVHPDLQNSEELMQKLTEEKMIRKFGKTKGQEINQKILKNTKEYFDVALNRYKAGNQGLPNGADPGAKLFSEMFEKSKTVKKYNSNSCIDLISLFWK